MQRWGFLAAIPLGCPCVSPLCCPSGRTLRCSGSASPEGKGPGAGESPSLPPSQKETLIPGEVNPYAGDPQWLWGWVVVVPALLLPCP